MQVLVESIYKMNIAKSLNTGNCKKIHSKSLKKVTSGENI